MDHTRLVAKDALRRAEAVLEIKLFNSRAFCARSQRRSRKSFSARRHPSLLHKENIAVYARACIHDCDRNVRFVAADIALVTRSSLVRALLELRGNVKAQRVHQKLTCRYETVPFGTNGMISAMRYLARAIFGRRFSISLI
jgi:hypothetical protein